MSRTTGCIPRIDFHACSMGQAQHNGKIFTIHTVWDNGGSAKTVELLCTRITVGTYVDGQNFIHVDDWNDESAAHNKLENMSTGSTFFHQQNTSNMLAREDMVAGTQEIESDFHNDCSV